MKKHKHDELNERAFRSCIFENHWKAMKKSLDRYESKKTRDLHIKD